jgi:hypothetical protein
MTSQNGKGAIVESHKPTTVAAEAKPKAKRNIRNITIGIVLTPQAVAENRSRWKTTVVSRNYRRPHVAMAHAAVNVHKKFQGSS